MSRRRLRRRLAASPLAARAYEGARAFAWWRRRRRSPLSWTGEYVPILSRIERDVPARPFADIRRQVEEELRRPAAEVFFELEPQPIACASISQVHRGTLQDGRRVAVKVRHPGIEKRVRGDTRALSRLLRLLARFDRGLDFRPIIDEIARIAPLELDLAAEARNQELLADNLAHRADVVVPAVISEHTTSRLLVMDLVDGIDIADVDATLAADIDPAGVAGLAYDLYCEQVFVHGFFHADPHPGNLLVQPGPRLVLLDYGLCRPLSPEFRLAFARLVNATTDLDLVRAMEAFRDLGLRTRNPDDPSSLLVTGKAFADLLRLGGYQDGDLVAAADAALRRALAANPIVAFPPELLLVLRLAGLLGWLATHLGRPGDWLAAARPYTQALLTEAA